MKHAYLILAHHEFALLENLISVLDDMRNDIFIHFDKKVDVLPNLETKFSNIYTVANRIDVRWGDVSVVEAEYELFEEASKTDVYAYYHLISGVDLPLKNQDDIHHFFASHQGKEFIGYSQYDYSSEVTRKVKRYHLFPRYFKCQIQWMGWFMRLIRYFFIKVQVTTSNRRNKNYDFKKGTQWVSVTDRFVRHVLSEKTKVLTMYSNTFCSDEIYKQTLCWHSEFKRNIYDSKNESNGCQRKIGWQNGVLYDWKQKDFKELYESDLLFARKFNSKDKRFIDMLLERTRLK